ncbi:hypothetical protein MMC17_000651 [Xylographa soralifera]|nr:hypothetical protein [Xylographa soralifera]
MERRRANEAEAARDTALEERDEALASLDSALARLDAATTDLQNAQGERDHAQAQLAALTTAHAAKLEEYRVEAQETIDNQHGDAVDCIIGLEDEHEEVVGCADACVQIAGEREAREEEDGRGEESAGAGGGAEAEEGRGGEDGGE